MKIIPQLDFFSVNFFGEKDSWQHLHSMTAVAATMALTHKGISGAGTIPRVVSAKCTTSGWASPGNPTNRKPRPVTPEKETGWFAEDRHARRALIETTQR